MGASAAAIAAWRTWQRLSKSSQLEIRQNRRKFHFPELLDFAIVVEWDE
jgi:hypothetical protein